MQAWAESFYYSPAWRNTSRAYLKYKAYVCERCGGAAVLVHHKVHLTRNNIGNKNVSLNWDNLEALCQDCHNKEHHGTKRYKVDEFGRVTPSEKVS